MTLEPNCNGDTPTIAPTAFVHPSAVLIGHVVVEDGVNIGPQAVLRADEPGADGAVRPIVVGADSNVQDAVVVHALGGTGVVIGPRSSIAHAAVLHGPCRIGAGCFIGFQSCVYKATLGDGVIVMHKALVEGADIADGLHVPSMTAVRNGDEAGRLTPANEEMIAFGKKVCEMNNFLAKAALNQ